MLDSKTVKSLKYIALSNLPNDAFKIFIFGSRAIGNNRQFSDIDLGIDGPRALSPQEFMTLKSAFDESDIPYRVDLVDFKKVSDKFKQVSLCKTINL